MLIHQEDPEVDMIDVLDQYAGQLITCKGGDGFTEVWTDDEVVTLEDDNGNAIETSLT